MGGWTQSVFKEVESGNLAALVSMFPSVQTLILLSLQDLGDVGLLELAVCFSLRWRQLRLMNRGSPAGLVSLCKLLPSLEKVQCVDCAQLD